MRGPTRNPGSYSSTRWGISTCFCDLTKPVKFKANFSPAVSYVNGDFFSVNICSDPTPGVGCVQVDTYGYNLFGGLFSILSGDLSGGKTYQTNLDSPYLAVQFNLAVYDPDFVTINNLVIECDSNGIPVTCAYPSTSTATATGTPTPSTSSTSTASSTPTPSTSSTSTSTASSTPTPSTSSTSTATSTPTPSTTSTATATVTPSPSTTSTSTATSSPS